MAWIAQLQEMMWAVNAVASVFLLALLAVRKNYRAYPAFAFYIFVNLALGAVLFSAYRRWGFHSKASWLFGWGMQCLVLGARALAVAEVCRHFLSRFPGIWALAKRLLSVCAGLVLLYSSLAVRHDWKLAPPTVDRGLELSIAAVIVILFLFARYYDLRPARADRSLAIGFCVYSCFRVLNDTISDRYLSDYEALWSFLGTLAFLASLLLWFWALRKTRTETVLETDLLPVGLYQAFAPQINLRLRTLNDQLCKIWKTEVPRS